LDRFYPRKRLSLALKACTFGNIGRRAAGAIEPFAGVKNLVALLNADIDISLNHFGRKLRHPSKKFENRNIPQELGFVVTN